MKLHILISLFLTLSFSAFAQRSKNSTSSLWIVADSAADIQQIDYLLYRRGDLISTIKSDSLIQYQAEPQRFQLSLLTDEYTLVINQLLDRPIVITNMTFNKGKITWLEIDRLVNKIENSPSELGRDVIIIDYERLKPPIYIDR